jgi:hypothetical protein
VGATDTKSRGSIWWDPREPDWWVATPFAIGSIFFTSAAGLQMLVATGAVRTGTRLRRAGRWRAIQRAPHDAGWWAGMVQFAGTLCFNVSTFLALEQNLTATEANRRVWAPDALGSIALLVASALAYALVRRPWITWRPRDLEWSVTTLNMVGSIAFGCSAVAAKVITTTGELRNAQVANAGNWIGGVCFLLGAVLLLPEEREVAATPRPAAAV